MDPDLVVLQEIRTTSRAQGARDAVLDGLHGLTGEERRVQLQDCGGPEWQHVGVLWNTAHVQPSPAR